jgi:hypothetical protein
MPKTLSQHLKDIGDELVEIVIEGERVKVSRTEALARRLYIMAMGGVEQVIEDGEIVEITHKADYRVAKSIREYTEGKAAQEPPKKSKQNAKPGQYDSEISRRLNERLGGGSGVGAEAKGEWPEPFPNIPEVWRDPKTGIMIPKRKEANLAWRMDLIEKAEKDTGMQRDLLAACAESQLFWVNGFAMTFHQFDVDEDGKRIESKHADQPMITWPIQDELLTRFEQCIADGEDVLIDKARDMGASWCCVEFMHWLMLFRQSEKPTELLEMSRNEDYVDKPGNMKALFQKHDYINQWLPDWMRPPDCFRGQANRSHMHWHNPITNATLDGESTTKHAARGDRRLAGLLDEFGAVQNGSAMRMASRIQQVAL